MNSILLILATTAHMYELPAGLLTSICFIESSHNPNAVHFEDGNQDSIGLCQLHLSTAQMMGFEGKEEDLLDPAVNANYAAKYLKYLSTRYKGKTIRAISAYNAGHYTTHNKKYVSKVLNHWKKDNNYDAPSLKKLSKVSK